MVGAMPGAGSTTNGGSASSLPDSAGRSSETLDTDASVASSGGFGVPLEPWQANNISGVEQRK